MHSRTNFVLWLTVLIIAFSSPALFAQSVNTQFEQSRQLSGANAPLGRSPSDSPLDSRTSITSDDAFGDQLILRRPERSQPFSAFAGVSAFLTNNVALSDQDRQKDKFLVGSAGTGYTQPLGRDFRLNAGVQYSIYRYDKFSQLDFQSFDASGGVSYAPSWLGGASVSLSYLFGDLSTPGGTEFYRNHAISLGVEKNWQISRAQSIFGGVSGQWSASNPTDAKRDEYVGLLGYRLQATRFFDTDFVYQYGHYVYHNGSEGRRDENHTLSLTIRYIPTKWLSVSATPFFAFNRSNYSEFDYNVINLGVTLQAYIRF